MTVHDNASIYADAKTSLYAAAALIIAGFAAEESPSWLSYTAVYGVIATVGLVSFFPRDSMARNCGTYLLASLPILLARLGGAAKSRSVAHQLARTQCLPVVVHGPKLPQACVVLCVHVARRLDVHSMFAALPVHEDFKVMYGQHVNSGGLSDFTTATLFDGLRVPKHGYARKERWKALKNMVEQGSRSRIMVFPFGFTPSHGPSSVYKPSGALIAMASRVPLYLMACKEREGNTHVLVLEVTHMLPETLGSAGKTPEDLRAFWRSNYERVERANEDILRVHRAMLAAAVRGQGSP